MKYLASMASVPPMLAALEQALGEHGASGLDRRVPRSIWRRALAGPAEEFLSRPGKALRTSLVHAGWMLSGSSDARLPAQLALLIELLHAGSLIIDDVEDGAAHRRGAPALHHVIGIPLAINTGSWMYFWSLAEIAELGLSPASELALFRTVSTTLVRCHQGQALDLAVRVCDLTITDAPDVVAATTQLKTGALCGLATSASAIAINAPRALVEVMERFGAAAGTALQMLDDLGSIASPTRREKGREDMRSLRPTWPWAWMAETRAFTWTRLIEQARAARDDTELDAAADTLASEVGELGRQRIRTLLDDALADLVRHAGDGPAIAAIGAALTRMEKSYG